MNAKELRLGNIVRHKYMKDLSYLKVRRIDGYGFKDSVFVVPLHVNSRHDFFIDEIEPIPITEETLKKCGFESFVKDIGDCKVGIFYYDGWHFGFLDDEGDVCAIHKDPIMNLHELQNCFYIATDKELEVKL